MKCYKCDGKEDERANSRFKKLILISKLKIELEMLNNLKAILEKNIEALKLVYKCETKIGENGYEK